MNSSVIRPTKLAGSSSEWRRFIPILIAECYLSFTVFVFAFGPWPWDVPNPVRLYTYLFLAQAALLLGYLSITTQWSFTTYTGHYSKSALLQVSVVLNYIAIIPFYYIQVGRLELSARGILSSIVAGAMDPGQAYKDILNAPRYSSHFLLLWAYVLFTPILWLSVPLGTEAWESLSLKMKAAIAFIVLANISTWIATGTIQGIADNAAIVALSLLARRRTLLIKGRNLRRVAAIVTALSTVVFYFSYAQNSRAHGKVMITRTDKEAGITLDTDNLLISGLPLGAQSFVASGCSYLTQGYYGLSLALQVPFQWTYGIGHSLFWIGVVQHFTGFDVTDLTYPARVDARFGWNMDVRWDSIYPWLASDVTFPGTLLIIFLIGRLLASVWIDTQTGENPYALPLFVIVMLLIFYFPANDKILTSAYQVGAFWGLLGLWLSTRRTIRKGRIGAWI